MAAVPFKVKAVFEYVSGHEDDLPFSVGQIITVTDEDDLEWYGGEYVDDAGVKREGIFPRNFVERFEPTAPPRPTRLRKKDPDHPISAGLASPPAVETPEQQFFEDDHTSMAAEETQEEMPIVTPRSPPMGAPPVPVSIPSEIVPVSAPAPVEYQNVGSIGHGSVVPPPQAKSPPPAQFRPPPPPVQPRSPPPVQSRSPPPVSQKPTGNSFKDRIAAFNKAAAPPIAPFKPSGLGSGSSGFVKKPFVAPPPSRNSYVPPPRDIPVAKVYRRDEDPEVKEAQAESAENTEKTRAIPDISSESQDENQPKPTTLKERIALLQKQQAEAAQRHADAAAKKEKPKRPPKKIVLGGDAPEPSTADQPADMAPPSDHRDSIDVNSKTSMDESRQSLSISRKSVENPEDDGSKAVTADSGEIDDTAESQGHSVSTEHDVSVPPASREGTAPGGQAVREDEEEEGQEAEEEEEEDEVDPEIRRKEELRARMAKMSGGMGMAGMFGPPGMMPFGGAPVKKAKAPVPTGRRASVMAEQPTSPIAMAPPVPTLMALPGLGRQPKQPEEISEPEPKQESDEEKATAMSVDDNLEPEPTSQPIGVPPPIPGGRPAPPPVPAESRPPPPPPPAAAEAVSYGPGSVPGDEVQESIGSPRTDRAPPPIPMASPPMPMSPRFSSDDRRGSSVGQEMSPNSPPFSPSQSSRRFSRPPPPPPIPGVAPPAPTQSRPPPPPPPGAVLSRPSTSGELTGTPMSPGSLGNDEDLAEIEDEEDTDITSSRLHQDALGVQVAETSSDDESSVPPEQPHTALPPVPSSTAPTTGPPPIPTQVNPTFRTSVDIPRAPPPSIPTQLPSHPRASVDSPRAAPPPPPPAQPGMQSYNDEEYDPYRHNPVQTPSGPSHSTSMLEEVEENAPYQALPPPAPMSPPDRRAPPSAPTSSKAPPKKSLDITRPAAVKRSLDMSRHSISMETAHMANELDLASHTQWWLSRHGVPPVFQGRKDIYTEFDELKSTEDGISFVTKTVSVLYQDYSQTVITVRYDPMNPAQAALDQQHEAPPRSLRQDELEEAYERFGRRIAQSVASKKDAIVGDGTPYALVHELLRPLQDALLPVGTRAYGALVYANLANASTQLNDEIRPGDIISIRNAKFQGKHGPMHAKYSMEVGKPDHVGIVAEWDGTKKKVRAWEQGRENKKCKQESFKLEDLRSGEVKIWRVMPRTWVGWSPKD